MHIGFLICNLALNQSSLNQYSDFLKKINKFHSIFMFQYL